MHLAKALTEEQKKMLSARGEKAIASFSSTEPANIDKAEKAVSEIYRLSDMPAPRFLWVDSPYQAALVLGLGTYLTELPGYLSGWEEVMARGNVDNVESLDDEGWIEVCKRFLLRIAPLEKKPPENIEEDLKFLVGLDREAVLCFRGKPDSYGEIKRLNFDDVVGSTVGSTGSLGYGYKYIDDIYCLTSRWISGFVDTQVNNDVANRFTMGTAWHLFYNVNCGAYGGQCDAGWAAYYAGMNDMGVYKKDLLLDMQLEAWTDLSDSIWSWYMFPKAALMVNRPEIFKYRINGDGLDHEAQLHCEDGPSVRFRDGFECYSWRGQAVPKELIEDKWTAADILTHRNTEVRRCAIEKMGWDRFIKEAELEQVGEDVPDPGNPGQYLALYDTPDVLYDEPVRVLLCSNGTLDRDGTRRRFGITVPVFIETPLEAQAWIHDDPNHPVRMTKDIYASLQRRC